MGSDSIRETSRTTTEQRFNQSGITLALNSPVITAVQSAQQMSQAAKQTRDGRMKLLAAANTALAAKNAAHAVTNRQGATINGKEGQIATGKTLANGSPETRDATPADRAGGFSLSITAGGSQSRHTTTQTSDTAAVSNLTAGRDITLAAGRAAAPESEGDLPESGGGLPGDAGNILLQGTNATAVRYFTLTAENDIALLAARNTSSHLRESRGSSGGAGLAITYGNKGFAA